MFPRKLFQVVFFICLLSFGPAVFAQQTVGGATSGRLVEIKVPAPALKGNLLADPVEQSVAIYLPPNYDTSPTKRFPVVYLLHGFLGNQQAWINGSYQGMSLQPLMDEMIKSGKSRELIVVAPNGAGGRSRRQEAGAGAGGRRQEGAGKSSGKCIS